MSIFLLVVKLRLHQIINYGNRKKRNLFPFFSNFGFCLALLLGSNMYNRVFKYQKKFKKILEGSYTHRGDTTWRQADCLFYTEGGACWKMIKPHSPTLDYLSLVYLSLSVHLAQFPSTPWLSPLGYWNDGGDNRCSLRSVDMLP